LQISLFGGMVDRMTGHQRGTEGVGGSTEEHQDQQIAQLLDMVHGLQKDALFNAIVFTSSDHFLCESSE
jgi:hypothetical protein